MALNYLSGRVSRFGVGVPGFSTSGDLTLDVAGAIGIGTSLPRAEIDTPNISIRGDIVDAAKFTGEVGYFLTQDAEGVKWIAANPGNLNTIRLFEDDVVVPPGSPFSGLNFKSPDPFFIEIDQNPGDPFLADIKFDPRWVKTEFDGNFGIGTGFGPDGTYASIPGYGTSDAVGVTSVGIGTNQPQDDFQVGIGSTGVTINGPEGRVKARILEADEIEVDGNLTVESLVVDPGIATFRGNIEAQGISSFTGDVTIGLATITLGDIEFGTLGIATIGFSSIGPVGAGATEEPALFVTGLSTFAGILTAQSDLFVGNNLYVAGEQFIEQLNANNVIVTGIATITETEILGAGITNLTVSGVSTLGDFSANIGIVTQLDAEDANIGIGSFGNLTSDEAIIGVVTVGIGSFDSIDSDLANLGSVSIGVATDEPALSVIGINTFTGFTTFIGDVSVSGILTVGTRFDVPSIGVEFLSVSGVGTINQVEFNVGIGSTLTAGEVFAGLGSFGLVSANDIVAAAGTIGGVGLSSGRVTADDIDADEGRIGILTGDSVTYTVGVFTDLTASVGSITTLTGQNLSFTSNSSINGVGFNTDQVFIPQQLEVVGATTFRGVGTFGTDLYVGNDLFVAGDTFFEQINAVNLDVSGIGTINDLKFNVGFGSTLGVLEFEAGIGTITNFDSEVGFVSFFQADRLKVEDPLDPIPNIYPDVPPIGSGYFSEIVVNNQTVNYSFLVGGASTFIGKITGETDLEIKRDAYIENLRFNIGVGTDLEVETFRAGIATIDDLDAEVLAVGVASIGFATVTDLAVGGAATFYGPVFIDDTIFINQEVTGVSTVNRLEFNVGVGTELTVGFASVGVATVGFLSVTDIEAVDIVATQSRVGVSTIGFASVGIDTQSGGLYVVGVNTFIGFTTFTGDVFINGDLELTGSQIIPQLDANGINVGVITIFDRVDATSVGVATFGALGVTSSFEVTAGVATIGLSTFSQDGDVTVARDLAVNGIGTFRDDLFVAGLTSLTSLNVTGVSTFNESFTQVGFADSLRVLDLTADVSAITTLTATNSTFISTSTFDGEAIFNEIVTVNNTATIDDLIVSGLSSLGFATIGVATVGLASVDQAFVGVLTTGTLEVESLVVEPGVSTFRGDVNIEANLGVSGLTTTTDLEVAGLASIGILTATAGFIDSLEFNEAIGGITSTGFLTVGTGSTTDSVISVTGVSTFVGLTSFVGEVFVDGDIFISGISSFQTIGADTGLVGVLTVSEYLDSEALNVSGFSSITEFGFNVGVGTTINVVDANVSGILSTGNLNIEEDLEVGRNLTVNGISTLGAPGPTGFTTTLGDLYVGGDLFVLDDIFYDEISGRNLNITGIATITELEFAVGVGTTAFIDELNYNVGVGTSALLQTANIGIATIGISSLTDVNIGGGLTVTGISSFQNLVTIESQLNVVGDVNISGVATVNTVLTDRIEALSGIITTLNAETITTVGLAASYIGAGVGTFTALRPIFIDSQPGGIATFFDADIRNSLSVGGLTSTRALDVEFDANVGGLTSTGRLSVDQNATIEGNLTVGGDSFLNQVSISTANVTDANVVILGVTSEFYSTGVSTFAFGLDVLNQPLFAQTLQAQTGFITTLSGDALNYNTGLFTSFNAASGIVTGNLGVGLTLTTTDLTVNNIAGINSINAVRASVGFLSVTTSADFELFTFRTGIGTNLTVVNGNFENLSVGVATVTNLGILTATVGILTVTQELNIKEFRQENAYKTTTNSIAPVVSFTIPPEYSAFEVTVLAREGSNFQTTKLNGINDGTTALYNEYSDVFNVTPVGTYEFTFNAGATDFVITPATVGLSTFTMSLSALKS